MKESASKRASGPDHRQPLAGRSVIITRAEAQASALRRPLADLGARVLEAPTIQVLAPADPAALDEALGAVRSYQWLVFTSANGVRAAAGRLATPGRAGGPVHWDPGDVRIAVIGSATAEALEGELGLRADLVPGRAVAEALAEELIRDHDPRGQRILLLRADIARPDLPQQLRQAGALVTDVAAYRTRPVDALPEHVLAALRNGDVDWISFTSASTVRNLAGLLGVERHLLGRVRIASIGPITTAAVRELGFDVAAEADPSDVAGVIGAIVAASAG